MKHVKRVSMLRADATEDLRQGIRWHFKELVYEMTRPYEAILEQIGGFVDLSQLGRKRER